MSELKSPIVSEQPQVNVESLPQKRRSRKDLLVWGIPLLLIGAGVGWGANWLLNSRNEPNTPAAGAIAGQPQTVPVKLATVTSAPVEDRLEVLASLEARRTVTIRPEISGRVTQILVNEGDRVRQGQPLVRLDDEDLRAELSQAQAALESARAQLAELEAGSRVEDIAEARASLAQAQARLTSATQGSRLQEIAQAEAQVRAAEAQAELSQQRVERYRQLRAEGAVSADQFQEYVTEERSNTASLREAEQRLAQLREARQSAIEELTAAAEQQRQNLRRLEAGARSEEIAQARAQVAEANARVRTAEANLAKTNVVSPWAGVVGDIPIKVGAYVAEGDELTALTENDILEVNLSIPVERRSQLRLGLPVEVLDVQGKVLTRGKISFVSPNVAPDAQLILAKATLDNVSGELINRQLTRARVIWNRRQGILVPATAISRLGGETFVFVAQESQPSPDGSRQLIARQKIVKLGNIQGNSYQVLEGLQPGERIVTAGLLNLSDGTPIASGS